MTRVIEVEVKEEEVEEELMKLQMIEDLEDMEDAEMIRTVIFLKNVRVESVESLTMIAETVNLMKNVYMVNVSMTIILDADLTEIVEIIKPANQEFAS